jgi:hypothetical protein
MGHAAFSRSGSNLKRTDPRQGQNPLKDRREADQNNKQLEKVCQARFPDEIVDGPKANCADHASNQNPDQD